MNKKNNRSFIVRLSLLIVSSSFLFSSVFLAYAAKPLYLTIQNQSGTSYERALVRIPLENPPNGSYRFVEEGTDPVHDNVKNAIITTPQNNCLLVTTSLQSEQTKVFHIQEKNASNINTIPTSTEAGTFFHFVNYENAYIVSCENDNQIDIYTENEELLDTILLQKGKSYTFSSSNPTNILIKSKKPVFVYESSLSLDPLSNKESEDSDTTTLYGDHLYFFHPGHLWISSYQKNTIVKILDENQLQVKDITIHPEQGVFIEDLPPGVYSIIANSPVTAQFGYVDNENFSFVIGQSNLIHGFSFGDLLFYSPYDNAQIKIQYGNKNSNFVLEKKGDTKLLSLIQSFSPSLPEYIYFTATCNVPFFVMSFSSGKNFGGEFSPGYHGAYLDTDFTMISSRISKEFSKDQKSLIEIYSQHPHTKATFSNSNPENDQTVTLNEFAIYNYSSSSSLEKVNISSDEPLLCLQLHNYTNKGLFYYIPPLDNTAITFSFSTSPSDQGGLFAHQSNTTLHPQMFFYPPRWKAFFLQILNPDLVLFTVFFAGLLILLFIIFILLVFKHRKEDIDSQFTVSSSHQTLHTPSTNSNEEPFSLPEKENSFSSIEKIHKKSLSTVKKQEPPNDDEMEAKPPIISFSKEADMQSSNEPIPATQESNKKIRFDPATTPSWLSEEHKEGTPDKTEIDDEEIPPFSSTQRHRKGLRITDPNLEDIDFQEGIPSLDIDEEDIFIQIKGKRTIPKTQQNECQKPSHTSYSSENESTPSPKPLVDPFLTENSSPSTNPIQQEGFQNSSQEPMKTNQAKENLKQTLSKSCSPQNDQNFESKNAKNMIERIYQEPVSEKLTKNTMVPSLENLFYTSVVFDPGSANRLYMEGYLQHFSKGYIGSTSAKKINSSIVALLKSIKLNPNDIAKASTMADVCDTFEEAGKAFALCKKKRIKVYITSYKLPKFLQGITVYSVHDIVKRFHSQDE